MNTNPQGAAVPVAEPLLRGGVLEAPHNRVVPQGSNPFGEGEGEREARRAPPARMERHLAALLPIASDDALDEVRLQELAENASEPNPLFEPWLALPLLGGRTDVVALQVWGCDAGGARRLDGLLLLERKRMARRLEYLRTWGHLLVPVGVPLVRAGVEQEVADALLGLVETQALPLLRLDGIPADGPFHRALVHACWLREWPLHLVHSQTRALFRPSRDAAAFTQEVLSGKRRRELRKALERLESLGTVRFTRLESGDAAAVSAWAGAYARLEGQGWKGEEGVAVGGAELDATQFERILRGALMRDRLHFLALELDGRPVAMNVAVLAGEGGYGLKTTYDESLARYMPGVQLYLHQLELLHQTAGLRWMDSCASPDRQLMNQLWPERRELHSLVVAADRPLASAIAASLPLTRWAKRWLVDRAPPREKLGRAQAQAEAP